MEYKLFNEQLRLARSYLLEIYSYNVRISQLQYDLANVKAIRYDKVPTTPNPSQIEEKRLELIDRIEEIERESKTTENLLKALNRKILKAFKKLDPFIIDMVLYQYGLKLNKHGLAVNGKPHTIREMCEVYHYSTNGIWQLIKREVEKI